MRHPDVSTAIACLASLFEYGEVTASTDPVKFIDSAYAEITALRARVAEYAEKDSEIISGQIDPSVGVAWMRCSPDLPEYVRSLEVSLAEYEDGPAEQVLRGRLEAVEQERDNAVELMAHRVEDIKAAILQSAPATTCYHCGAVVEQGEEHWLVCDLHPAGQKYRALLSWSAKAEAVRVAAEAYQSYRVTMATKKDRGWDDGIDHSNWTSLGTALSSCPPLESVTGKEAEGETPDAAESALSSVLVERAKQDAKWGVQNHEPEWWYAILGEEFGEVGRAMLEARFGNAPTEKIRDEVVQCAAVALAWVECIVRAALAAEEERG